jgi:hypothetical protein
MGRLYVASVLISISGKGQTRQAIEADLAPIVPGSWAAWARKTEPQPAVAPAARPAVTTLQPVGSKA